MPNSETIEDILKIIRDHEVFLVCSHANPDGDSIGSQLAFYSFLTEIGKKVYFLKTNQIPFSYKFLPYSNDYQNQPDAINISDMEVAIILDCGNLDRIGDLSAKVKSECMIVNIDHHSSNDYFGKHNFVDINASATSEIVFRFIKQGGLKIGYERAVCLYTGIITDTGFFRYANTTPESHRIIADLIEEGIKPDYISELIYDVIPYRKARLFGLALETLQKSDDGKIAWMSVTLDMYKQTQTDVEDTERFIDYIRSIEGIEVAIFLRETDKDVKVSLRSKKSGQGRQAINVEHIASEFGGGGHPVAAGCNIDKPIDSALELILERVRSAQINSL
jgi:bifunctional oligoribonuclease and PAP phosphatase NrnA